MIRFSLSILLLGVALGLTGTVHAQTMEYNFTETTVGQLGGETVSLSGIYKVDVPGSGRQRAVDLVIGGREQLNGVHSGQEIEAGGQRWEIAKIRKGCFGKGAVTFRGPLTSNN